MRGVHSKVLGVVLIGALIGSACGSTDNSSSSTGVAPVDTTADGGTTVPVPRPTNAPPAGGDSTISDDEANFGAADLAVAEGFWAEAIGKCNAMMVDDGGVALFDGGVDDPTVGVSMGDRVADGVFAVTDTNGAQLLVDLNTFTVTGPDGPDGIMPRPYSLVCPLDVFVGKFDEDGMEDEAGPSDDPPSLRAGGLGDVDFGADPDSTISIITNTLGEPDADSGWIGSFSVWGTCPGPMIRVVQWSNLDVLFTDGITQYNPGGGPHFFNWRVPDLNGEGDDAKLTTSAGIGFGSTVEELQNAYASDVEVDFDPDREYWYFHISGGSDAGITGALLDGGTPADTIAFLEAGALCGD